MPISVCPADDRDIFFYCTGYLHASRNAGAEQRIHLVFDVMITKESAEFFFGDGQYTQRWRV